MLDGDEPQENALSINNREPGFVKRALTRFIGLVLCLLLHVAVAKDITIVRLKVITVKVEKLSAEFY